MKTPDGGWGFAVVRTWLRPFVILQLSKFAGRLRGVVQGYVKDGEERGDGARCICMRVGLRHWFETCFWVVDPSHPIHSNHEMCQSPGGGVEEADVCNASL